jgi:hypothetical protein
MAPLPSTSVTGPLRGKGWPVRRATPVRRETLHGTAPRRRRKAADLTDRPDFARGRAFYRPGGQQPLRFPPHARRSPRSSRGPLASHAPSARRWVERRPVPAWAAALPAVARRPPRLPPRQRSADQRGRLRMVCESFAALEGLDPQGWNNAVTEWPTTGDDDARCAHASRRIGVKCGPEARSHQHRRPLAPARGSQHWCPPPR